MAEVGNPIQGNAKVVNQIKIKHMSDDTAVGVEETPVEPTESSPEGEQGNTEATEATPEENANPEGVTEEAPQE